MPETARILPFRGRKVAPSRKEATARALDFLARERSERSEEFVESVLCDADVISAVLKQLASRLNTTPSVVSEEASSVYAWLLDRSHQDFLFDEREYFLGECALLAAGGFRLVGKWADSERWLDRADANFRHTVSPAAQLARVAYLRLALRYDARKHDDVLELIPSVALSFQKLGMAADLAKCYFLEAMSLKELGRTDDAAEKFLRLVSASPAGTSQALVGMALVNLGDVFSMDGNFEKALDAYRRAVPVLEAEDQRYALADLKFMLGRTLQRMGYIEASLQAFSEAAAGHADLGMETRAAYVRIVFAEALLAAGKPREAEWQVLAALPTIDEHKLAPEGYAAVSLLSESVRQRKTDPKALLEVREYLQGRS